MKMYYHHIVLLCTLLLAVSCQKESVLRPGNELAGEVTVYFNIGTPMSSATKTRSTTVSESEIRQLVILRLFKKDGAYRYSDMIKPQQLSINGGTYVYSAKIAATTDDLKLYLIANVEEAELAFLSSADDEASIRTKLVKSYPNDFGDIIPMFDEIALSQGLNHEQTLQARLVRSMARADIYNLDPTNFELLSARVYRTHTKMQLIPNDMQDHTVFEPSIPSGSQQTVRTADVTASLEKIVQQLYFTESAASAPANRLLGATCVVIGGRYGEETTETFYRLDFVPDDNYDIYGQILRNHKYVFRISNVTGSGWKTPDEAANNLPVNLEVRIQEWNEKTHDMVFDGVNHFGVSDRNVLMSYVAGSFYAVAVDTDLPTYTLHWLNPDGTVNDNISSFTLGDRSTDPSNLFQVSINDLGTELGVKTLSNNITGAERSVKLLARAGRLELVITLTQDYKRTVPRTIYVYGSANGIGRFGDELLGNNSNASRPEAMIKMLKNKNNFGSGGTMDFSGFMFGANDTYEIRDYYADIFDVIYLPYLFNANTSVDLIIDEIIPNPTKVLIIQYDDANTNRRLLNKMGIEFTYNNSVTPYQLAEDIPEFLRDGIFGELSATMNFRCYDTSHGEISRAVAAANNITPILYGGDGGVVLGIDIDRKIVYSGDIDLYMTTQGANSGLYISSDGVVRNQADILIANLWAWIADCILTADPWN